MLSSIHPLGERSRQNKWWLTVASFGVAATAAGAGIAALGGLIGAQTLGSGPHWGVLVAGVGGATIFDSLRIRPRGPRRQVNENWIGAFRGWVYGIGFGAQLGTGIATYIVTWGVYATYVSFVAIAEPGLAAIIGAVFGLGRTLSLLLAAFVDRPSRLATFNRALARIGPFARMASVVALASFTLIAVIGVAR